MLSNTFGKRKNKKIKWGVASIVLVGIAIPLFHFFFFWCQTNIKFILQAFQVEEGGSVSWSLTNFQLFFNEVRNPFSSIGNAFVNTIKAFFFDLLIQTTLCFLFSFFIYKRIKGYQFFRWVFFLPNIISGVVLAGVVGAIAGVTGPLPEIWEHLFGYKPMFFQNEKYAFKFLLLYTLWSGFGVNLLYFTSAMNRISPEMMESATLDGITLWGEIRYMVIPLIWPTLSTILLLKFTNIWNSSVPVLLFTRGEYGTNILSYWIFSNTQNGNYNYVSAVGLILTFVSLPVVLLVRWIASKVETSEY